MKDVKELNIAGAGLAGLLAAHAWPTAAVWEPMSEPRSHHKALLRFRSQAVAQLVGIEFQSVTVRKGIWVGSFVPPDPQLANWYSFKVLGSAESDRSIWNLEPVQRFIAPESLYEQLVDAVDRRILWNSPFDYTAGERVISTAPLPVVLNALAEHLEVKDPSPIDFKRAAIRVDRYRVPRCAVYQSVYFPHPETPVYRASITGDLLIVESVAGRVPDDRQLRQVFAAFGLMVDAQPIDTVEQKYGKIVPLPSDIRRALLHRLTEKHGVFSLGRFATWRNVLLDDVVSDIAVIRRLLLASKYDRSLHFSNRNT